MRFNNLNKAIEYLRPIFEKGKAVSISEVKERRSLDQNALYWLWLTCIENEQGQDKDDLHEYFAKKYLPMVEKKVFETIIYSKGSTKKLNTAEFKHYLDKIQVFSSSELSISLPNPDDLHFEEFKNHYKDYL